MKFFIWSKELHKFISNGCVPQEDILTIPIWTAMALLLDTILLPLGLYLWKKYQQTIKGK